MRILGLNKTEVLAIVIAGLLCIGLASEAWARTMLEDQPKEDQCKYRANLTGFVVDQHQRAIRAGEPLPHIGVNFRPDASDTEREMVDGYLRRAVIIAEEIGITPSQAATRTFRECMSAVDARLTGEFCGPLNDMAPTKACAVHVDSAEPPIRKIPVQNLPSDLKPVNYQAEWCWTVAKDATEIVDAYRHNKSPQRLKGLVMQTSYFSPRHKAQAIAMIDELIAVAQAEGDPQQWFAETVRACMEGAEPGV